jgi:hypothetical protein
MDEATSRAPNARRLRIVLHAASAAGVVGATALLLADEAGPQCGATALDLTLDVSTTCYGPHSGRIRITHAEATGWDPPEVRVSSGNLVLNDVTVRSAECKHDGEEMKPGGVSLVFARFPTGYADAGAAVLPTDDAGRPLAADGGPAAADEGQDMSYCSVDLTRDEGRDVECIADTASTGNAGCTVRLTEVQ